MLCFEDRKTLTKCRFQLCTLKSSFNLLSPSFWRTREHVQVFQPCSSPPLQTLHVRPCIIAVWMLACKNVEACNQTLEGHLKPEHFEKAVRPEREFVKGRRNDDG